MGCDRGWGAQWGPKRRHRGREGTQQDQRGPTRPDSLQPTREELSGASRYSGVPSVSVGPKRDAKWDQEGLSGTSEDDQT